MLRFLLVVIMFAIATYFVIRLVQQRGLMPKSPIQRPKPRPRPRPRVIGPDDDDEFLRDLDRKRLNPEDPDA